jgi:hypothetical protein
MKDGKERVSSWRAFLQILDIRLPPSSLLPTHPFSYPTHLLFSALKDSPVNLGQ